MTWSSAPELALGAQGSSSNLPLLVKKKEGKKKEKEGGKSFFLIKINKLQLHVR